MRPVGARSEASAPIEARTQCAGRLGPDRRPIQGRDMRYLNKLSNTGRTPLAVVVAVSGTMLLSGGAYATASTLITGKDVKNNSLTGKDIRNRSLTAVDFKKGLIKAGKNGLNGTAGTVGAAGIRGADGLSGKDGRKGKDGLNATPAVDGVDGLSAYELAVAGGYDGTLG